MKEDPTSDLEKALDSWRLRAPTEELKNRILNRAFEAWEETPGIIEWKPLRPWLLAMAASMALYLGAAWWNQAFVLAPAFATIPAARAHSMEEDYAGWGHPFPGARIRRITPGTLPVALERRRELIEQLSEQAFLHVYVPPREQSQNFRQNADEESI